MPGIQGFAAPLGPSAPLTRVILIRDQIVTKVGGNVQGNLLTSIAGTGRYVWMPGSGAPGQVPLAALPRLLPPKATHRRLDGT